MLLIDIPVFAIAVITLFVASWQDVKHREIDNFVFIPLVMVGAAASFFNSTPYAITIYFVVLFATLFFKLEPWWIYPVIGIISTVLVFFFSPRGFLLFLMIPAAFYFMGTGEKFFGIGDIKALLALSLAFNYPLIYDLLTPNFFQSILPFSFSLMVYVTIAAGLLSLFVTISESRGRTDGRKLASFIPYDEDRYNRNPERYNIVVQGGRKIMIFQLPFLVGITAGFIAASLLGPWFIG